jgi:hypothetical protein
MNIDAELEVWREAWQSGTSGLADLQKKVERQSRFMRFALLIDVVVTIGVGGGVIVYAVLSPQPDVLLLAAVTWLFLAAAWMFSLSVNRGNWSPLAMDTAAFLDVSIRRCRGRLKAVRFGATLFVTEIVFCLGWIYSHSYQQKTTLLRWLLFSSISIGAVWLMTLVFALFLFWYRKRKNAELVYLLGLREQTKH